jgi:pilus assembly protein CpaE
MAKIIQIALEMADKAMVKEISRILDEIPEVSTSVWFNAMGEKGALAVKTPPDILIVDEQPGGDRFFERLRNLRKNFPQAALFVVSAEKNPEHIVQVMKAGAKEFLVLPVRERILATAVEEVRHDMADTGRLNKATVCSFISSKGGLGATVLAVNVAAALAEENKPGSVALCDTSFQSGDTSVLLDVLPPTSIMDLCRNIHRLDAALLQGVMVRHSSGVEVLAAPSHVEDMDEVSPEKYATILDVLRKRYSRIVIDCPSMHVDDITVHSFNISERIFVVIDLSIPAIRNGVRLAAVMRQFGVPDEKIFFVVNRFAKSNLLSIGEAEKSLGKKIFWLFPNDFEEIITSINEGEPMVRFRPHSGFSKNIRAFLDKVEGRARDEAYRGASGAFRRPV